ncbi:MAG: hypothetical protein ACRDJ4_14925 [Actinomycetota bacterium]
MKRGLSGRSRRGSPPLPRQRAALRVVQITLLGVSVVLAVMAIRAYSAASGPAPRALEAVTTAGFGEVAFLAVASLLFAGLAAAMGLRAIRGPEPPKLD